VDGTGHVISGALAALVLLMGCGSERSSGPVRVHWDRDPCERCAMALGSQRFAAQVRGPDRRRVHLFDDIGCALIWIHENVEETQRGSLEIWVGDPTGAKWVDAREARFSDGFETPMGYGYATVEPGSRESIDLAELQQRLSTRDHGRRRRAP